MRPRDLFMIYFSVGRSYLYRSQTHHVSNPPPPTPPARAADLITGEQHARPIPLPTSADGGNQYNISNFAQNNDLMFAQEMSAPPLVRRRDGDMANTAHCGHGGRAVRPGRSLRQLDFARLWVIERGGSFGGRARACQAPHLVHDRGGLAVCGCIVVLALLLLLLLVLLPHRGDPEPSARRNRNSMLRVDEPEP